MHQTDECRARRVAPEQRSTKEIAGEAEDARARKTHVKKTTSLIGTELRNVPHDDHTNRAHCPLVPGHAARRSPFTVIQS